MSSEKQRLYDEIYPLPNSLTNKVIDYIEYLKFSYVEDTAPEELEIKSKQDLKEKLQAGLDDIKEGKVYSLDEMIERIERM